MVKFAKNGSDVTTAAVRLARAATGRDLVAFPTEHPFSRSTTGSSARPWSTPASRERCQDLSLTFSYGDLDALERLFAEHPGADRRVIIETATDVRSARRASSRACAS